MTPRRAARCLLALLLAAGPAAAAVDSRPAGQGLPEAVRDVTIVQKLGEAVPADTIFVDDQGRQVRLGDYFGQRPVLLSFVYYECPMLCTLVLNGVVRVLRAVDLEPGKDFEIVTVSIDPRETPELARVKKQQYVDSYRKEGAREGWHFLTGSAASIERLTEAAGFRYRYDESTGQFAHASAIMLLTPDGRLHRYFHGVEYAPRDLRLGIVDAGQGRIGSRVDTLLLYCFHYDPVTGRYGLAIMTLIRALGVATVAAIAAFVVTAVRRDRRRAARARGATA
ncbi:MAG: SCO family protein [Candidatus Polarisedimenticolia bacterium]